MKTVLGIETSCDDTSVCILRGEKGSTDFPQILSHRSFSQETILSKWGGVVPEIAARNHLAKITPLLEQVFEEAGVEPNEIDLIGVTTHPGLLGPLLTGLNAAKTISMLHRVPIVSVNHLYAHLEAIHLTEKITYPYLGLICSGGHSIYMLVSSSTEMEVLGTTIDDAAGEAFDKGGKLMGIGYPGGKLIDDMAKLGDDKRFEFPIGLTGSKDANLSYSGVKTSLRQLLEKNPEFVATTPGDQQSQDLYDICASYQKAIIKALGKKMGFAYQMAKEKVGRDIPIVVGGGVAANSGLRALLSKEYKDVHFVKMSYCTDNGAMIANYALINQDLSVPFPDCLYLDARGRFIDKKKGKKV